MTVTPADIGQIVRYNDGSRAGNASNSRHGRLLEFDNRGRAVVQPIHGAHKHERHKLSPDECKVWKKLAEQDYSAPERTPEPKEPKPVVKATHIPTVTHSSTRTHDRATSGNGVHDTKPTPIEELSMDELMARIAKQAEGTRGLSRAVDEAREEVEAAKELLAEAEADWKDQAVILQQLRSEFDKRIKSIATLEIES